MRSQANSHGGQLFDFWRRLRHLFHGWTILNNNQDITCHHFDISRSLMHSDRQEISSPFGTFWCTNFFGPNNPPVMCEPKPEPIKYLVRNYFGSPPIFPSLDINNLSLQGKNYCKKLAFQWTSPLIRVQYSWWINSIEEYRNKRDRFSPQIWPDDVEHWSLLYCSWDSQVNSGHAQLWTKPQMESLHRKAEEKYLGKETQENYCGYQWAISRPHIGYSI